MASRYSAKALTATILSALALKAALFASSFGFVALYAYGVHPGESASYYEQWAARNVPIFAASMSVPLVFFAARAVSRRLLVDGRTALSTALSFWATWAAFDVPFLFGMAPGKTLFICLGALLTTLGAAFLAGRSTRAVADLAAT